MERKYSYLFGPVPSRRFGRSLGVDLTPYKTCTLDCIFCQLGRTTNKTVERREYVPIDAVLAELEEWLRTEDEADYVTLSGSGEPTLHSHFGEVLEYVRANSAVPAVLLTNGTMLHLAEVREAACQANIVKVSLSAWDQTSYERLNRPHPELGFDQLIEGQRAFRAEFKGQLWLEVFLVEGVNSTPVDVEKIAALVTAIGPQRVQLNTAVRPAAEELVTPVSKKRLQALSDLFHPPAEVIGEFNLGGVKNLRANEGMVVSMLQRRPCTAEQIANVFGMHPNEVAKYVGRLMRTNQVREHRKNGAVYYSVVARRRRQGVQR